MINLNYPWVSIWSNKSSYWDRPNVNSQLLCFSRGLCAPPPCRSPAPPSPPPPPPPPAPVSGALRPGTWTGGVRTERPVLLGWDRPPPCPSSTRTSLRDSVSLRTRVKLLYTTDV